MSGEALRALLPIIALAAASVVVMLAIAVTRSHRAAFALTLLGLAASAATLPLATDVAPRAVTTLLVVDGYALFFMGLMLAAGAVVAVLAYPYFEARREFREEFYLLLLLAVLGALVLAASTHFASLFLGLELVSVALFGLIAYVGRARRPLEAGVKYLLLSGASSAFLLLGMAFVYAELGVMSFAGIGERVASAAFDEAFLLAGSALIVVGIGFKLSVVPFHMWTPDVFEGAPAPVGALLGSVSKGAVFALLLRYFLEADVYRYDSLLLLLSLVAVASMLVGNLLALLQDNLKRLLAYSSIANLGYLLVAFIVGGALGVEAASYFLVAYFVAILAAFGVVSIVSREGTEGDADAVDDYRGLFWRRPALAGVMTLTLLSLAGIPLTVGFIGKFYLFAAGIDAARWALVFALALGSAIGLYYYVRVIVTMYMAPLAATAPLPGPSWSGGLVLAALTFMLIGLGVWPAPIIDVIQATVAAVPQASDLAVHR